MAYQYPLNGGRINATIGGNTAGAGSLVSTGTLSLVGGNNVTLSQNGNAITISAGTALSTQSNQALSGSNGSFAFQTATFGNSNGLSFYTTNGSMVGSYTVPTQTAYSFSNANGVSFGTNGSTVTATVATTYAASNHSHGNPTLNLTNISGTTASASNGLTLSLSAGAQTAQTIGLYATGANTTGQSSSNTLDARSFSISAQGGLYAGMSGNTLQLSAATTYAASNHSHGNPTLNLTNLSGTTASASNGLTLSLSAASQSVQTQSNIQGIIASGSTNRTGDISFANSNGVTFGLSNNTVTASVAAGAGGGVALYDGVNSISSGTARVSAGGALTASVNGQTLSLNAPAQSSLSQTGIVSISRNGSTISIGAPAFSAGISTNGNTSGTSGTVSNQIIFAGGNNITLSQSTDAVGNTISISGANQTNQNISLYALGNTTQNSSTLLNASNLSFNGLGGATVGFSNGSIQISGATGGAGGGGVALSANTLISSGTASLSAGGALTISGNGQTLSFNAPSQSNLSATGIVSISNNGSTISIGAPAFSAGIASNSTVTNQVLLTAGNNISLSQSTDGNGATIAIHGESGGGGAAQTLNFYQNMDRGTTGSLAVPMASLMLQRLNQENDLFAGDLTANTVLINMTANMTATSLSSAHSVSVSIGIYSDNATNLSLINSASTSWALAANTGNTSAYNGPRWLSFVSSQWSSTPAFVDGGDYVFGIVFRSSSYAPPLSYYGQNYMISNQRSGTIGTSLAANTTLAQGNYWNAVMATTSLPTGITSNQVNRNNASAIFIPHIILNNRYSGTF